MRLRWHLPLLPFFGLRQIDWLTDSLGGPRARSAVLCEAPGIRKMFVLARRLRRRRNLRRDGFWATAATHGRDIREPGVAPALGCETQGMRRSPRFTHDVSSLRPTGCLSLQSPSLSSPCWQASPYRVQCFLGSFLFLLRGASKHSLDESFAGLNRRKCQAGVAL